METKTVFDVRTLSLFAMICLLATCLLFAACQAPQKPTSSKESTSLPPEPQPVIPQNEIPLVNATVDIAIADANKSVAQKQQEVIVNAIADGTYIDNVSYISPGGKDLISITVDVENDVVTKVNIREITADETSQSYIYAVNKELQTLVVGKKITELNLPTQISGSSLTTRAFKQHITRLIAEN